MNLSWEETTQKNFHKILEEIPDLIRGIAETRVSKKAQSLILEQNRSIIEEKDMVAAFFAETPKGFIPAMRNSMQTIGIDYKKYGYE